MADSSEPPKEVLANSLPFLKATETLLKMTPHFGVLAPSLESETVTTRLDYILQQCQLLYKLKRQVPGLGLGSKNFLDCACLKGFTGLDICQSWSILLNYGHLFGTFATERPLLFELDRDLEFRNIFVVECTRGATSDLRDDVEIILDEGRLYSFHYLLALWRLRTGNSASFPPDYLNKARHLVKAFLQRPSDSKLENLKSIFKRVRALTYLSIHARLNNRPHTIGKISEQDLSSLFPQDALPEADWLSSSRWDVYKAMDRFDSETLFADTNASLSVLRHINEFRRWWRDSKIPVPARIDQLFVKPGDWPTDTKAELLHLIELRIPSPMGWIHEVRHWLRDDSESDPWEGSEFLITPSALDDQPLKVAVFTQPSCFSVRTLEHITRQLARPYSGAAEFQDQRTLWMSTARLAALAFGSLLNTEYRIRLTPSHARSDHVGYATAGATYEFVRGRVKAFLPHLQDAQRAKELRQLLWVADSVVGWRNPCLVLLARTEIINSQGKIITELDGVLGYFRNNSLHWLIVETKKETTGGDRQLKEKFFPTLLGTAPQVQNRQQGTEAIWFVTLEAPTKLALPRAAA